MTTVDMYDSSPDSGPVSSSRRVTLPSPAPYPTLPSAGIMPRLNPYQGIAPRERTDIATAIGNALTGYGLVTSGFLSQNLARDERVVERWVQVSDAKYDFAHKSTVKP